jgi:hypothetical protein
MIISIAIHRGTLAVVTYDGAEVTCIKTLAMNRTTWPDLWNTLFGYAAGRARQNGGKVGKVVLYQNGGDISETERMFGLLTGVAGEFNCPLERAHCDDEDEARAWRMLPGGEDTAVALALGAAMKVINRKEDEK